MSVSASRWMDLPNWEVADHQDDLQLFWESHGDEDKRCRVAASKSISTYPVLPNGERDGDPNADHLLLQLFNKRAFVAIADGCNWGNRPREAAKNATIALKEYMSRRHGQVRDLHDAAHLLLRGFAEADKKIMEGKEEFWEAGTTTLLAGCLLRFKQQKKGDPKWGFVACSVGDCKAFHYSRRKRVATDLTAGNRINVTDTRDPGGRLGPYLEGGVPDLRNLSLYFCPCDENDLLILVSDG